MRRHLPHQLVIAASAVGALSGATAEAASAPVTVKTARNATLHHTILVNRSGRTLYSLSAEGNGRFICTDRECLSFWTPLVVRRGARPKGSVASVSTVRRPDGRVTSARYSVELATTSGRRVALPSLQLDPRTGSAGQAIPVDLRTVASVRLVGPRGDVLEAQLRRAPTGTP